MQSKLNLYSWCAVSTIIYLIKKSLFKRTKGFIFFQFELINFDIIVPKISSVVGIIIVKSVLWGLKQ